MEDRQAIYSKKFHQLELWTSNNSTGFCNCDSKEQAKAIINKSVVTQSLKIVK